MPGSSTKKLDLKTAALLTRRQLCQYYTGWNLNWTQCTQWSSYTRIRQHLVFLATGKWNSLSHVTLQICRVTWNFVFCFNKNFAYTVPCGSCTVLYRCLHMVYIYHNVIEIPSFQSSHIQFHMVPVRFFTDAYTWYTYTIMALRSPHSKVHIYGSIRFPYSSLQMPLRVCTFYTVPYIYTSMLQVFTLLTIVGPRNI